MRACDPMLIRCQPVIHELRSTARAILRICRGIGAEEKAHARSKLLAVIGQEHSQVRRRPWCGSRCQCVRSSTTSTADDPARHAVPSATPAHSCTAFDDSCLRGLSLTLAHDYP